MRRFSTYAPSAAAARRGLRLHISNLEPDRRSFRSGATQAQIAAASDFAYNLGIAFQIKDDILDITGTSEMLGKPVGSDSDQGKVTYATKVGLEKAQQDVELLTDKALESLRAFDDTDFLQALAQSLISRDH